MEQNNTYNIDPENEEFIRKLADIVRKDKERLVIESMVADAVRESDPSAPAADKPVKGRINRKFRYIAAAAVLIIAASSVFYIMEQGGPAVKNQQINIVKSEQKPEQPAEKEEAVLADQGTTQQEPEAVAPQPEEQKGTESHQEEIAEASTNRRKPSEGSVRRSAQENATTSRAVERRDSDNEVMVASNDKESNDEQIPVPTTRSIQPVSPPQPQTRSLSKTPRDSFLAYQYQDKQQDSPMQKRPSNNIDDQIVGVDSKDAANRNQGLGGSYETVKPHDAYNFDIGMDFGDILKVKRIVLSILDAHGFKIEALRESANHIIIRTMPDFGYSDKLKKNIKYSVLTIINKSNNFSISVKLNIYTPYKEPESDVQDYIKNKMSIEYMFNQQLKKSFRNKFNLK